MNVHLDSVSTVQETAMRMTDLRAQREDPWEFCKAHIHCYLEVQGSKKLWVYEELFDGAGKVKFSLP